jgi:hypothetical protein
MPFDEFTVEQLAGDLLPHPTPSQIIATGFNRNSMINEEGGIDPLEYRFYSMVDRVQVTSTTWMGLTMACAQCHTHKYDPIIHNEYYRFMACLDNAIEPVYKIADTNIIAQREKSQKQIATLEDTLPEKFPMEPRIQWQTPAQAEFSSVNGTMADLLSDGSFRVSGANPEKDAYTITVTDPPRKITHVQLEAIPDDQDGRGTVGRAESGNFVLSKLEIEVATNGSAKKRMVNTIKFASVDADYSQDGFPAQNAITDNGRNNTGWAVGGKETQLHHAIFALEKPLELPPSTTLTLRLVQSYGQHHTLARFRLSLGAALPNDAVAEARRNRLRDQRCEQWLADQLPGAVHWQALHPVSATSTAPILTVQDDDSVLCSGDFTKSDTYTIKFASLPADVKALRLEMIADDRLPNGGPGSVYYEGEFGDFWLSTVRVKGDGASLAMTNASESFAEGENNAAKTLDDDPQTGWSIKGGVGKTQNAVFQFSQGATVTNDLQLDMVCEKYYAAGLGRFRIWATTNENARATVMDNQGVAALARYGDRAKLKALFASTNASPDRDILVHEFALYSPAFATPREEIDKLRASIPKLPTTLVMQERPPGQERKTFVHHRGEFLQTEEQVTPGVPAFLPQLPTNAPQNRLALARWLVSGSNPLTGRVIMNREWETLFGRGIVGTLGDFGYQGDLPSHPELLDWLAVEFVKQGWSQKKMLKLMVMSATYQQSSDVSSNLLEHDPMNLLLARGPRFRLDAEMVRDSALVASGLLSEKIGGASVYPPQPPGVSSEGAYGPLEWNTSMGPDRYRRGIYTFAKRTAPYAMAATFDAPSGEVCLAQRDRSDTPLQALTSLNDEVFLECARAMGQMATKASGDDTARIDLMFRRCLARPPTDDERAALLRFYQAQLARFNSGDLNAANMMDVTTDTKPADNLNQQAAWATVARVLLNLDEMINLS